MVGAAQDAPRCTWKPDYPPLKSAIYRRDVALSDETNALEKVVAGNQVRLNRTLAGPTSSGSTDAVSPPVREPAPRASGKPTASSLGRLAGILFGVATQALFAVTVLYLFLFLRDGGWSAFSDWWLVDTLLAIGFVVPHSLLLAPPPRNGFGSGFQVVCMVAFTAR